MPSLFVLSIFQFQYGAIKSDDYSKTFFYFVVFQFQYGAIKSYLGVYIRLLYLYFNSSMVRLKVLNKFYVL